MGGVIMVDIRDRFVSYGTRPDVYDAPSPLECVTIASEVQRLREALKVCWDAIDEPTGPMGRIDAVNQARSALANHRDA